MKGEKAELTTRSIPRRSPIQVLTAQSSLTAVIGREPVFSRRYGREHVCVIEITSWLVSAYDFYSRVVKDR